MSIDTGAGPQRASIPVGILAGSVTCGSGSPVATADPGLKFFGGG